MLVEGDALLSSTSFSNRDRNTENGVGTEFALVRRPVELDQEVVDIFLLGDGEASLDKFRGDNVVDIGNSLGYTLKARCEIMARINDKYINLRTFSDVCVLIAVTEFDGFVDTGRGSGRNSSTVAAYFKYKTVD